MDYDDTYWQSKLLACEADNAALRMDNAALRSQLSSKGAMLESLQDLLLDSSPCPSKSAVSVTMHSDLLAARVQLGSDAQSLTKAVAVTDARGKPLLVQTQPMTLPFGLSSALSDPARLCKKRSVVLSFASASDAFAVQMLRLQDRVRVAWSAKGLQFCASIKTSDAFAPTLRVSVPDGCKCFDDRKQEVHDVAQCLDRGASVACIIKCNGVWFTATHYGLSWSLLQARQTCNVLTSYAFADD